MVRTALLLRLLAVLRVGLVAAVPLTVVFFLWRLPSAPRLEGNTTPVAPEATAASPNAARELAWYSPLWTRNLKEPPIPKGIPQPSVAPDKNLPVLLATLVEPEGRYAHFSSPSGQPRLRAVDELIDEYRVLEIEPGRVKLQRSDRLVWVEIPKPPGRQ